MRRRRGFDAASLVSGIAVAALGLVLLLHFAGAIELSFGYLWPALFATIGASLLAMGLSDR
jgi:hypothetical protein